MQTGTGRTIDDDELDARARGSQRRGATASNMDVSDVARFRREAAVTGYFA
jgi:hypothetical protein